MKDPEGKKQSRRHNPSRLQTIPQSYSNQNCGTGTKTDTQINGTE